ncbi:MAG: Clp protease N-terminal domain-containing protein, partial [Methanosarcinaceae archaeon]
MELNKFTQKAQEALQHTSTIAARYHNQQIDCEHLSLALLEQEEGLVPKILEKIDIQPQTITKKLEQNLSQLPQVSGPGSEQVYMTQKLNRVLDTANKEAGKMCDEYVSVEHLLLALVIEKDNASGKILKDAGVTKDNLLQAINDIRGGKKVTSENAEDTYEALKKYGIDLTELASQGKLDPVIGR